MSDKKVVPGVGGDRCTPYEERTGNESIVYFTRDLSAEGLKKIYQRVSAKLVGKVGIKLHTGEQHGPNIIPRDAEGERLDLLSRRYHGRGRNGDFAREGWEVVQGNVGR